LDSEKCQYESILGQLAFVMKDSEDALFHFQNAARCKIPSDPYLQSYLLLAKDALQVFFFFFFFFFGSIIKK